MEVGLIFDFRDVENRKCIRCDTLRIFPHRENRRAIQDPLSQQGGVLPRFLGHVTKIPEPRHPTGELFLVNLLGWRPFFGRSFLPLHLLAPLWLHALPNRHSLLSS